MMRARDLLILAVTLVASYAALAELLRSLF